jgi:hypothetical protein
LLEETLGDTEQQEVSAHIAVCPGCRQCLESLTDTSALLATLRRPALTPSTCRPS